jgi:hypothetical protein
LCYWLRELTLLTTRHWYGPCQQLVYVLLIWDIGSTGRPCLPKVFHYLIFK